jgi:hypothetical protein
MAEELTIRAAIEILMKGDGGARASAALKRIEEEAKKAGVEVGALGAKAGGAAKGVDQVGQAGEKTGQALGTASEEAQRLGQALRGATEEDRRQAAQQLAESFGRLGEELKRTGEGAQGLQLADRFTRQLAESGGPIQQQLVPAVTRFLGITRELPGSLAAVKLSVDLSKEANVSFADAARGVAAVLKGDVRVAAEALGVALRNQNGQLRQEAEILAELRGKYGDLASRAQGARAEVDRFSRATTEATRTQGRMAESLKTLGRQLLGFFGLFQALRFGREAVREFAAIERGFNAIRIVMRNLGLDAEKELPKVEDRLRAIQDAGDGLLRETIPVFQKFIGITRDTDAALAATGLAANIAESGFVDVGTAAQALALVIQGQGVRALSSLGIQLRGVNAETATNAEIVEALFAQYGNLADSLKDTTDAIDRQAAAWSNLKELVGSALAPAVTVTSGALSALIKGFQGLGAIIGTDIGVIIAAFENLGSVLAATFDFRKLFVEGPAKYRAELTRVLAEAAADVSAALEGGLSELDSIYRKRGQVSATAEAEARKTLEDIARRKAAEEDAKEAAKLAEQRKDFERDLAADLAAIRAEGAQTGTRERLDAELSALEIERTARLEEAKKLHADLAKVNEAFDAERVRRLDDFNRTRAERAREAEIAVLEAQIATAEEGSQRRLDLELELLDREYDAKIAAAEAAEEDITALQLAHALARADKAAIFAEAGAQAEIDSLRSLGEARADAEAADLELRIASAKIAHEQTLGLDRELIQLEADERKRAILAEEEDDIARVEHKRDLAIEQIEIAKQIGIANLRASLASDEQIAEASAEFESQKVELREETDKQITRVHERTSARLQAVTSRTNKAIIELEKATAEARKQQFIQSANTILGALTTLFPKSKAIAIALALINTYEAVTKAFAQGGIFGLITGAIMLAAGLKQVANIQKTNIGTSSGGASVGGQAQAPASSAVPAAVVRGGESAPGTRPTRQEPETPERRRQTVPLRLTRGGFDEPESDELARRTGRRWADDLLREVGRGMFARLQETRLQPPSNAITNDNRSSTSNAFDQREEFHFHGLTVLGKRSEFRRAVREIQRESVRDQPRRMR